MLKGSKTEGSVVIHFSTGFHGRSGYTLSLTNTNDPRSISVFPSLFDWPRIINPKLYFPITEENLQETIKNEQLALVQIEEDFIKSR